MTPKLLAALLTIALPLALSGCAKGEAPRAADIIAPAQAFTDFGDLRVHYNVMPTLTLPEAMAREYRVAKDADTALVFVALRRLANGEEQAAQGEEGEKERGLVHGGPLEKGGPPEGPPGRLGGSRGRGGQYPRGLGQG